jgi:hypothetical protein
MKKAVSPGGGGTNGAKPPEENLPVAWQPLTMRGVAAFANATLRRLLLVQFMVALLAAGSVMWFLHRAWFPTIAEAVRHLPLQGEFRSGRLEWAAESPVCLAEGRFLAVVVDPEHTGKAHSPAHVQVEFGRNDLQMRSLFGSVRWPYPRRAMAFNQPELGPWWGAWSPAILAIAGGAVVAGLMVTWACLATLYFLPVWVLGFLADRTCTLGGAWLLAGAAQMPGALLMCVAILLYGGGAFDLVRLAAAAVVHLVAGWVYLIGSPFYLPRYAEVKQAKENPFA